MINNKSEVQRQLSSLLPACLLLVSCLLGVHCQDELQRALNGDKNVAAESAIIAAPSGRAAYNSRLGYNPHHQIMHFGKRPELALPSALSGSRVYDLYLQQQQQQQEQQPRLGNKFPNWFNLKLEQGQSLEPLEEDATAFEFPSSVNNKAIPIYSIMSQEQPRLTSNLLSSNSLFNRILLQGAGGSSGVKFSRLMSDPSASSESVPSVGSGDASNSEQLEQPSISVVTRSPHSSSRSSFAFAPKNNKIISTLLLGRDSTPSMGSNFGSFIKKAEPKDNIFMHFG